MTDARTHAPAAIDPESPYHPAREVGHDHFSLRRIYAMVLRHFYLLRGSGPRLLELMYWPTVQVVLWGLITRFFREDSSYVEGAVGVLLAGVLLWDLVFRSNVGFAMSFMEEMYSRNLGHLYASPLRPSEHIVAMTVMSVLRTMLGVIPATFIAYFLYEYLIYTMGVPLIPFVINMMISGWILALVSSALLFRFGLGAESAAWVLVFALAPMSGIYYPLETLPESVRWLAWCLPTGYVFEGMRAVLVHNEFRADLLVQGFLINLAYYAAAVAAWLWAFHDARRRGHILTMGE